MVKAFPFIIFSILICPSLFASDVRIRLEKNKNEIRLKTEKARLQLCTSDNFCENRLQQGSLVLESFKAGFRLKSTGGKLFKKAYLYSSSIISSEGNRYPQNLRIIFKDNSKMDLIGDLDMEEYLKGVLPSEMPASWPIESLKAQAVASRTYVLHQIGEKKHLHFDVDNDVMDQVYKRKRLPKKWQDKVDIALRTTRSMVITRNQRAVKAFFHSHCGGHTEMAANVWPGSLGFESVKDPFCKRNAPFQWKTGKTYKAIEAAYLKKSGDHEVRDLYSVQMGEKNESGRIESLYLFFKNKKIRRWSATEFREAMGYSNVKSTRFQIQMRDKEVFISGSGYGHGVGLCQHGAKIMAKKGKDFHQILSHYYPRTYLAKTPELKSSFVSKR